MLLNPAGPNERKHPRKFDIENLIPKIRQAKTHSIKTNFSSLLTIY